MKLTKTKLRQLIKEVLEAEEIIAPTDDIYLDRETSDRFGLPYENTEETTRFGPNQIKELIKKAGINNSTITQNIQNNIMLN